LLERFNIEKWKEYKYIVDDYEDFINRHLHRYAWALKQINFNDIVLDIGCGLGYGTSFLRFGCSHIEGIEVNKKTVKYAKDKYNYPKLIFHNIDFEKFRITKKRENLFSVVTCIESFEHMINHDLVLLKIVKLLRASGKLLITTPHGIKDGEKIHEEHEYEFTKREIYEMLKKYFSQIKFFEAEMFGIKPFKGREFIVLQARYPKKELV
jgi:2-polyprenyl-3-methyl-5-hydroxy-6-metoxy-1,4-benzoquinol methylase